MTRRLFSKISTSTTIQGVGRSSLRRFLKSRRTIRASTSSYRELRAKDGRSEVARMPPAAAAPRKRLREVMGESYLRMTLQSFLILLLTAAALRAQTYD